MPKTWQDVAEARQKVIDLQKAQIEMLNKILALQEERMLAAGLPVFKK